MSLARFKLHALVLGLALLVQGSRAAAQNAETTLGQDKPVKQESKPKGGEPGWQPPSLKEFSEAQRQQECKKYNGKLIGYYEKVYKVEGCTRREITDETLINRMTKGGRKVHQVESDTIAMLAVGPALASETKASVNCQKLEGRYIISGASEIHLVQACKRRSFPDWETFNSHRKGRSKARNSIIELTAEQFSALPDGEELPSILDEAYQQSVRLEGEADVIPIDEACRGLNGKLVSYYSKVYRIEGCRKRELLNPGESQALRNRDRQLPELSSEQWLSLPDGRPL